jgi:hypothetical protein
MLCVSAAQVSAVRINAHGILDVIEVRRRAGDQMPAATWVISRRYSEFHDLNKKLRGKFPQVRNLEFPRRQMMLKLQKDFLHIRRIGLEKYLRVQLPTHFTRSGG